MRNKPLISLFRPGSSLRQSFAIMTICLIATAASAQTGDGDLLGGEAVAPAPLIAEGTVETTAPRNVQSPVLTLNQDAIFSKSALGQRIIAELERVRAALAAENRRIETELSAEEQALTEQRPSLPAAEFAQLASEFDARVQALRASQDRKSAALQDRLAAERQNFASQVGPVLVQIARERGALVILDSTVVLMSFDVVDVTNDAIARLDAAIGDGRSNLGTALQPETPAEPDPNLRPVPRISPKLGGGLSDAVTGTDGAQ